MSFSEPERVDYALGEINPLTVFALALANSHPNPALLAKHFNLEAAFRTSRVGENRPF